MMTNKRRRIISIWRRTSWLSTYIQRMIPSIDDGREIADIEEFSRLLWKSIIFSRERIDKEITRSRTPTIKSRTPAVVEILINTGTYQNSLYLQRSSHTSICCVGIGIFVSGGSKSIACNENTFDDILLITVIVDEMNTAILDDKHRIVRIERTVYREISLW